MEKLKGYIYLITSPRSKIYIGKTVNIKNRISNYKGLHCKGQRIIYNSIKKYGWDSHTFEILESGLFSKEELSSLEKYYISKYKTFVRYNKEGMNLTLGGEGCTNLIHSKETKLKISETKKNQPRTQREVEASNKRIGVKINKSSEWIKNNSKSVRKPINQYDLKGNFIKRWEGAIEVEKELGLSRKGIFPNLKKITHSAYGFVWGYENDTSIKPKPTPKGKRKPVYDFRNNKIYKSITEASFELKVSTGTIINRIKSKQLEYYDKSI